MKNQEHNQNKEMPMEKLFQEAFIDHKETTSEQDFDQFFSKLEDTGYFNEGWSWKRPVCFISGLAVVAGLIAAYFFFKDPEKKDIPANVNTEVKSSVDFATENSDTDSIVVSNVKASGKADRKQLLNKNAASEPLDADVDISSQPVLVEDVPVAKDSVVKVITPEKKKVAKDSIRVRYVMAVDTVKSIDSLNIKKRKYQKMKEKSK